MFYASPHRRAAIWAGIYAGIAATAAQLLLWLLFSGQALPALFYRDTRLTAALVMGRDILIPADTFDPVALPVATLIHFALSAIYGLVLGGFVPRGGTAPALLVGSVFGLLLYLLNLYVFTAIFPWFAPARGWITIASHIVFGITAAGAYKALSAA